MNLPPIDLSTVLFLLHLLAFLLGARGLNTHLRDGGETPARSARHSVTATHHLQ